MDLKKSPFEGTSSDKHDILDQLARKPLDADEAEDSEVEWFPDFFMDMSRALTEKDLSRISQAIGSGWKHLGAELGISQAEIEQICEDNRKTSMKIFNMLRQWSIQASVNATVNTLHNAMKNCRKVTFDMKVIERVFAGI